MSDPVRAWATVREMLADRGELDLAAPSSNLASDTEVRAMAEEAVTFSVSLGPDSAAVFHTAPTVVKKADLFGMPGEATHIILIAAQAPQGPTIRSLMAEAAARDKRLELFTLRELQYNISQHRYVPEHRLMSQEDVAALLRRLRIASTDPLPAILRGDPMARYLGLATGQVVQITRKSQTNGITTAYRVCV